MLVMMKAFSTDWWVEMIKESYRYEKTNPKRFTDLCIFCLRRANYALHK